MSWMRFFRRREWDVERAHELQSYLQIEADRNASRGLLPDEARYAAQRKLGNATRVREEVYRMNSIGYPETLWQDIRHGLRTLRKNPRFTAIAVLTLALGIGANTAVFSMVNALLLHPYNFRDLDKIVRIWENRGIDEGLDARFLAPADAADLKSNSTVFEGVAVYRWQNFNLSTEGNAQQALGVSVSSNFFSLLGARPALGRTFLESEEQPGNDQAAILSQAMWQRQFGGDPNILGKPMRINGRVFTIVGVMPVEFKYPVPVELWTPLALTPAEKVDRAKLSLVAIGLLKPGVSIAQARAELDGFSRQWAQSHPLTNSGRMATCLEIRKELYSFTLPLFGLLQVAAIFVLLLACANLASLLFAHMIGRQKEIAVRAALGAGRLRLAQLYVVETVLLSLSAGIVATGTSLWSVKALRTSIPVGWTQWVPGWDGIELNFSVLAFTILLAVVVGVGCGIAAVLHAGRVELNVRLKEGGPGVLSRAKAKLRSSLVVSQVVFALVLLVCAGLMIQGFLLLANIYKELEAANVLRLEISLPKESYADDAKITSFYQGVLRGTAQLTGVSGVALSSNLPASNVDNESTFFTIQGRPALKASESPSADLRIASADYFRTLKVPLVSGRLFMDVDSVAGARVAVISRSMATRFWPANDAVGQYIKLGPPDSIEPWLTIVGVVADVRQNWWGSSTQPEIYEPFLQAPKRSMFMALRTAAGPASYASAVREVIRRMDSNVALNSMNVYENEVNDSIAIVRIMGILMGVFGIVALLLSSIGVYGVMSEGVAQRTREMGIRVALGAKPVDLMRLVLGQALKLTLIGLIIGLPISFLINRAMAKFVLGIVSVDLSVLALFSLLLAAVALAAGYFPARRAMRVDPLIALRYE
jgi:putative ABC transport system permease protein